MAISSSSALGTLNRTFESGGNPDGLWDEWVWHSDLHERVSAQYPLARSHLLGLLVLRQRARLQPELMHLRLNELFPHIVHGSVPVSDLSLRQTRDAAEDLQMHWAEYADDERLTRALDALSTRFGQIAMRGDPKLSDPLSVDPLTNALTAPAVRRFTSLFCVLYRHLALSAAAEDEEGEGGEAAAPDPLGNELQAYHVHAGLDDFYRHAMFADIPPAARILYKGDFQGMYHCVTQVVYMHFPSYERRRQIDLDRLRTGRHLINALSALLQMCPEDAHLVYEDETLRPGWNWVLLSGGGALYLVQWPSFRVYTASSIWTLVRRSGLLLGPSAPSS